MRQRWTRGDFTDQPLGRVVTAGVHWHIKDHSTAYVSYDYTVVDTDYTGNTAGAGTNRRITARFNPSTLVVSVGYSFFEPEDMFRAN